MDRAFDLIQFKSILLDLAAMNNFFCQFVDDIPSDILEAGWIY